MRHSQKRALALLIALLMALPTFAYAEEPGSGIVGTEIVDVDALIISDEVDPSVEEMEEIPLDDAETHDPDETAEALTADIEGALADDPDETACDAPSVAEETPVECFTRTASVDGVNITVTAPCGAFPEGSALRVTKVSDAGLVTPVPDTMDTEDDGETEQDYTGSLLGEPDTVF